MKDFLAEGSAAISHGEIRLPSKDNEASTIVFPMSSDEQMLPKAANVNAKLANSQTQALTVIEPVSEVVGRKNSLYWSLGKRSLDLLLVILALPIALPLILLPAFGVVDGRGIPLLHPGTSGSER